MTKEDLKSLTSQCKKLLQSQRTTVHHLAQVIVIIWLPWTKQSFRHPYIKGAYKSLETNLYSPPPLIRYLISCWDEWAMMNLKWWIDHGSEWRSEQILTSQPALTIESRRVRPELECSLLVPWGCDRGSLEHSGTGFSTLIASSSWQHGWSSSEMPRTWQFIWRYRQYSSRSIYQQDGRYAFERSLPVNTWDVELVHRLPNNHLSGTSTRFAESSTRQGIKVQGGFIQMGFRQSYLWT